MHALLAAGDEASSARPIWFVTPATIGGVLAALPQPQRDWVAAAGFEPKAGQHLLLPDAAGSLAGVLFGLEGPDARQRDGFLPGKLATALPPGLYRFANAPHDARLAALGWLTGSYRFTRYRGGEDKPVRLVLPEGVDGAELGRIAEAVALGRDLINTPANDLGPEELEAAMRGLAERHGAAMRAVVGAELLSQNFPMVHAVGRAAARAPRLLDFTWGDPTAPKVTLVGKGVVFDTGGLNIKPESSMALMKKDMGGAACVLACAAMIMGAGLKLRLRVIVPAVENAISGSAFRPSDVLASRKGLTVEIGNTDAEGRLILADALALADEEAPDLIVDMATLTGAARVALGPELPALFTDSDELAASLQAHGLAEADPAWRLPLWAPYDSLLDSKIASVNHISGGPFAGSITAALFLRRFVEKARAYAHFDLFCWTPTARPGRPFGAEVMAARALYAHLADRFR
ncbi:leucyl aminopeptidase family protein [Labrys wisconsinensis]|uniref:Leucyl aminopeptidase n=1 Tax=Labrys wisconsinensis TaxID=425677 RepID=A0ABU0JJV0_9HYPH|nr:leucyl aminopeptidase family protein [Labrys wisconsinensis]MDQ0473761.1 leucyl aminopeptidase [Labrys wisconsinensis]